MLRSEPRVTLEGVARRCDPNLSPNPHPNPNPNPTPHPTPNPTPNQEGPRKSAKGEMAKRAMKGEVR